MIPQPLSLNASYLLVAIRFFPIIGVSGLRLYFHQLIGLPEVIDDRQLITTILDYYLACLVCIERLLVSIASYLIVVDVVHH